MMKHEMSFGVATLQHLPWEDELKRWKQIETLGFDTVWLADHFVNYMNPTESWFEAWTLLAALASHTSKIRVGTLVTSIPMRNPAVLARQAMTVDRISGGRLELGLGAGAPGSYDPMYTMTGIEDWKPAERVARFREQVEIIDQCLRQRVTNYEGKYYRLKNTAIYPAPVQNPRPPITIGGMGKSILKIAAQYADRWNTIGGDFGVSPDVMVENVESQIKTLDAYCKELGREPLTLKRSLFVWGAEAQTAFVSEQNFIDIYERYHQIGIDELVLFYPFFDPRQIPMFEQIAREVIPNLKE